MSPQNKQAHPKTNSNLAPSSTHVRKRNPQRRQLQTAQNPSCAPDKIRQNQLKSRAHNAQRRSREQTAL
ncbi:hypothetical protein JTE90_019937 [Oedothorax gibbosus]|uniref:Uncharacterized protein n=1 Tax=Oedothorax gibbosus TaxID=931172 RepID=A0AAV6UTP1_9ARAC|nr:hypothetical protein JTE90_019937 [Oedothorax gibbosus]